MFICRRLAGKMQVTTRNTLNVSEWVSGLMSESVTGELMSEWVSGPLSKTVRKWGEWLVSESGGWVSERESERGREWEGYREWADEWQSE